MAITVIFILMFLIQMSLRLAAFFYILFVLVHEMLLFHSLLCYLSCGSFFVVFMLNGG